MTDQSWHQAGEDFLVHVKPLSILFRAKFRDALKKTKLFALVSPETWQQDWVVHCQPVGNGLAALKYLAPYIFRVAISNKRILKLADGKVTFRYTESSTGQTRICTLTAEEFIRRFLQHVLAKRLSLRSATTASSAPGLRHRLHRVRQLLGAQDTNESQEPSQETAPNSEVACRCPHCGQVMRLIQTLKPNRHRPP